MLKYRQPFGNMSCFANLGVTADYMLKGKNINAKEIKFFSEETTEIAKAIPDPRNYDIGFVGGLGFAAQPALVIS